MWDAMASPHCTSFAFNTRHPIPPPFPRPHCTFFAINTRLPVQRLVYRLRAQLFRSIISQETAFFDGELPTAIARHCCVAPHGSKAADEALTREGLYIESARKGSVLATNAVEHTRQRCLHPCIGQGGAAVLKTVSRHVGRRLQDRRAAESTGQRHTGHAVIDDPGGSANLTAAVGIIHRDCSCKPLVWAKL